MTSSLDGLCFPGRILAAAGTYSVTDDGSVNSSKCDSGELTLLDYGVRLLVLCSASIVRSLVELLLEGLLLSVVGRTRFLGRHVCLCEETLFPVEGRSVKIQDLKKRGQAGSFLLIPVSHQIPCSHLGIRNRSILGSRNPIQFRRLQIMGVTSSRRDRGVMSLLPDKSR